MADRPQGVAQDEARHLGPEPAPGSVIQARMHAGKHTAQGGLVLGSGEGREGPSHAGEDLGGHCEAQ